MLRLGVIISNYNYGHFLEQCISSVLSQTLMPAKIIIVDDGSTDDSIEILNRFAASAEKIHLITKSNAGQLSCFNACVKLLDGIDFVFLLDADDLWPSDYLAQVSVHLDQNVDMSFVNTEIFESTKGTTLMSSKVNDDDSVLLQSTESITRILDGWIGTPTSAIGVSVRCYTRLLPYDDEDSWRTRADDVIVYGVSLIGGCKLYIPSLSICYRRHESNAYLGSSEVDCEARRLAKRKLFVSLASDNSRSKYSLLKCLLYEYPAVPASLRESFFIPNLARASIKLICWLVRRAI